MHTLNQFEHIALVTRVSTSLGDAYDQNARIPPVHEGGGVVAISPVHPQLV